MFECGYCDRSFATQRGLNVHWTKKHNLSKEKGKGRSKVTTSVFANASPLTSNDTTFSSEMVSFESRMAFNNQAETLPTDTHAMLWLDNEIRRDVLGVDQDEHFPFLEEEDSFLEGNVLEMPDRGNGVILYPGDYWPQRFDEEEGNATRQRTTRPTGITRSEIMLIELAYKHNLSQEGVKGFMKWAADEVESVKETERKCRNISTIHNAMDKEHLQIFGNDQMISSSFCTLIGDSPSMRNVCFEDPIELMKEILLDPVITTPTSTTFGYRERVDPVTNERLYDVVSSADWMKEYTSKYAQEFSENVVLLPVILYTDGTTVDNAMRCTVKPVILKLGIYEYKTDTKRRSKRLIGYFPELDSVETLPNLSSFGNKNPSTRVFYHSVWRLILDRIEEAGVFTLELPNGLGRKSFKPVVIFWSGDMPEQIKLSSTYDSASAKRPCRVCIITKEERKAVGGVNPIEFEPTLRTERAMDVERSKHVLDIETTESQRRENNNNARREYSIHFEEPAWHNRWPYEPTGIFCKTPPCSLHTFLSKGLVMFLIEYITLALKYDGYPTVLNEATREVKAAPKGFEARIRKFDLRFRSIPQFAQGKRYLRTFSSITKAKCVQGHEYHSVLYQLPFVIGSRDDVLISDSELMKNIRKVVMQLIGIIRMIYPYRSNAFTENDISKLKTNIVEFQKAYCDTFAPFMNKNLPSRKLHDLTHYPMFIKLYFYIYLRYQIVFLHLSLINF